ncbi:unnamed protein product [marine sediment metagenome]|uniref:Terminase small subunit n=1 Tax=marine sediment metagenome TaxID=412755 RepID=X0ZDC0_9ZZZZ
MKIKRTLRERKFIDAYIKNNGNATKAFLVVSPNAKHPKQYGYRMLQKVDLSVSELLNEMGMTDAYLNQKLKEGLNATKVISVIPIPPKDAKPGTGDLPLANEKNVDFIDVEDYNVRVKYLDMALKLKGKYPAEKHEITERKVVVIGKKEGKDEKNNT